MKARDLIFIAIVITVIGGLYYLSTKNRAKPLPPQPPEHLTMQAREDCLKCHLPETLATLERQHKHPGKWRDARVSCLLCHTAPKGAAAQTLKSQFSNSPSQISYFPGNHPWPSLKQN